MTDVRENVDRIRNTLYARDPDNTLIAIGGTGISLQLRSAGLVDVPTPDVDVLCSQDYFDNLLVQAPELTDVQSVRVRWWRGRVGEENASIDIWPAADLAAKQLPFTAATGMGDVFPISHELVVSSPDRIVTALGVKCLALSEILLWKAIVGRPKDLVRVDNVLPPAVEAGLVSPAEEAGIRLWCELALSRVASDRRLRARHGVMITPNAARLASTVEGGCRA